METSFSCLASDACINHLCLHSQPPLEVIVFVNGTVLICNSFFFLRASAARVVIWVCMLKIVFCLQKY